MFSPDLLTQDYLVSLKKEEIGLSLLKKIQIDFSFLQTEN